MKHIVQAKALAVAGDDDAGLLERGDHFEVEAIGALHHIEDLEGSSFLALGDAELCASFEALEAASLLEDLSEQGFAFGVIARDLAHNAGRAGSKQRKEKE